VILTDGRHLVGSLKGYDQTYNLVLEGCKERAYSGEGMQEVDLGTYIVRGDTVAVVGEVDAAIDATLDAGKLTGEALQECFPGRAGY